MMDADCAGPGKDEQQRAKYFPKMPNWRQQYVTSRNLEKNIDYISPPDQHERDTDTAVPEGWKLGKDA